MLSINCTAFIREDRFLKRTAAAIPTVGTHSPLILWFLLLTHAVSKIAWVNGALFSSSSSNFSSEKSSNLSLLGDLKQLGCFVEHNPLHSESICFNSFSAGPYKRRTCTVYGTVYDFADSYLRFGACYVDENTTIRFSETISPNSYQ
jgi:hypothetical protein